MNSELDLTARGSGIRFAVRVKPRSSRSKLMGVREGGLDVALKSPPVDGAANSELVKLLAKVLGIPKTAVNIASGTSSRQKLVDVDQLDVAAARTRLTAELAS